MIYVLFYHLYRYISIYLPLARPIDTLAVYDINPGPCPGLVTSAYNQNGWHINWSDCQSSMPSSKFCYYTQQFIGSSCWQAVENFNLKFVSGLKFEAFDYLEWSCNIVNVVPIERFYTFLFYFNVHNFGSHLTNQIWEHS